MLFVRKLSAWAIKENLYALQGDLLRAYIVFDSKKKIDMFPILNV